MTDGQLRLHWTPDLTGGFPARVYSVYGTPQLFNGFSSTPITNLPADTPVSVQSFTTNRVFKVGVGIP